MENAVLGFLKDFLIVYLVLTILMHLTAADQYKKYLKFFSGMVLMLMLVSPVFRFLHSDGRLKALMSYDAFWERLDKQSGQNLREMDFLQNSRYLEKYEEAVAQDIRNRMKDSIDEQSGQNLQVSRIKVRLDGSYGIQSVTVFMHDADEQAKESVVRFLKEVYGLEERRIFLS